MRSTNGFHGRGLLCIILLACPAAALAEQGWGTSPDLLSGISTTGGTIYAPLVEVDAGGNAVALWTEPGLTSNGVGPIVRTARRSALTARWSEPLTLASGPPSSSASDLGMDAAGNAVAVWSSSFISANRMVGASRFEASTGLWTTIAVGQRTFVAGSGQVAVNAAGDALLCMVENVSPGGVTCQSYLAATATWSAAQTVTSVFASTLDVEIDGAGNGAAVWLTEGGLAVKAARYQAATRTWGPATDLTTGLPSPGIPNPQVAMNEAGDAVATWTRGTVIEAARLPFGVTSWTAPVTLSWFSLSNEAARAVIAPSGDVTVAWIQIGPGVRTSIPRLIAATRYDVTAGAWSLPAILPDQTAAFAYGPPGVDVDAGGNVHVVWSQSLASPGIRLLASRYAVASGQWTTVTNLSAENQSAYNPDVAVDDRGNAIATWFQTAGGFSAPQSLRWAATPAPPRITGVTPSTSAVSLNVALPSGPDPGLAPTTLDYSLDGGASWVTRSPPEIASPVVVSGLADGVTYAVAIRAVNAAGPGAASAPQQVRAGAGGASPTDFRVAGRSGNRLTFAWVAPAAGFVPPGYEIEGGIAGQVLATIPTGGAATQFSVTAPDGMFFVRVVATAGALRSAPSNEIVVTVGGAAPPLPPTNLLASKNGPTIALSWTTVLELGAPTELSLLVGGAPTLLSARLPPVEAATFAELPGRFAYGFTLSAINAGGTSGPSNAVNLMQSSTCGGAPGTPRAFSTSTQGGVAYLDWLPPSAGEAITGYVVTVSGAFTGGFALSARTLAVPVPSGRYTVSVASTGLCGTSAPTLAQTIVVP